MAEKLAVDGGTPVRSAPWPDWPVWGAEEEEAILDVLRSGQWWSVGGRKVPELQEAFARFQDARHGICVTNGTAAIEVCLRALGIGCGDEVIVPPYTFIATASSVLAVSATPIFVDIDPVTLTLDASLIEEAITPRTKAVIPVHMAGCPADMDSIMAVAGERGLYVIEDAAQAHAAEWDGRKIGAIGHLGTFSFQASKNLNCGEGGIILTNHDDLADRIWSVHNVGRTRGGGWYEHPVLGGNFRMTEWQAAILLEQLRRLPDQAARRSRNADHLADLLREIPGITPIPDASVLTPRVSRITNHAYHLFVFLYDASAFGGRSRAEFLKALQAEGVPCAAGYVPLYREKVFQLKQRREGAWCQAAREVDYAGLSLPVCERVCREAVWLGQNILLAKREEMDEIGDAVARIQRAWG